MSQTKAGYTCVPCGRKYQLVKTGVILATMFNDPPTEYEMWEADLHQCPKCGHQAVLGVANQPFGVHFQDVFADLLQKAQDSGRIVLRQYER